MRNKKSLGQHWLKNREILEEIAELAAGGAVGEEVEPRSGEDAGSGHTRSSVPVCVEIGPGLGTLTSSLLKRFEKVVAVEVDADLAAKLPKSFPGKNLEVVNADILEYDFAETVGGAGAGSADGAGANSANGAGAELADGAGTEFANGTETGFADKAETGLANGAEAGFVVAGNIPYYITSPIIEKLLGLEVLPRRIVLLVQREVAERIASEKESWLSLSVKNRAEVALGAVVPKEEFTPPPKVDSRVLVLTPHAATVGAEVMRLAKAGFAAPRKKLMHNLAGKPLEVDVGSRTAKPFDEEAGGKAAKRSFSREEVGKALVAAGIDENARSGDLHLEDWKRLWEELSR